MSEAETTGPRIRAAWLESAAISKVFAAFKAAGVEARVVGGAVRNALIDRPVRDIDIATPALPDAVMRIARDGGLGAHPTGVDHGTVTVVADGTPFEVTTLRRDVETDGRHAVVAFSTSWLDDARRRDFTINALYCGSDGIVYDPVGGLEDLRRRRVRFMGEPEARIREDYLRILRFFRFSADYGGGRLDPEGLAAATALKDGLSRLSSERIRTEILKLLAAPKAAEVVNVMHAAGILKLIIPANADPGNLRRLQAIERELGQPPDALARLAALAISGASGAAAVSERLRLSNSEAATLETIALPRAGLDPADPDTKARATLYELGREAFPSAIRVAWARSGASPSDNAWRRRALLADRWKPPRMSFTGADVVALGLSEGPAVGRVLKAFESWWIASDFPADKASQSEKLRALAAAERA
jgi:poly(A) polymerase